MPGGGEVAGDAPQLQRHDLQLLEVELFGPDGQVNVSAASNPGGASENGQAASRAVDGNKVDKWSKWFDDNMDTRGNSTLVRVRLRVRLRLRLRVRVRVRVRVRARVRV